MLIGCPSSVQSGATDGAKPGADGTLPRNKP